MRTRLLHGGQRIRKGKQGLGDQTITLEDFQGLCPSSGLWGRSMEVEVKNIRFEIKSMQIQTLSLTSFVVFSNST